MHRNVYTRLYVCAPKKVRTDDARIDNWDENTTQKTKTHVQQAGCRYKRKSKAMNYFGNINYSYDVEKSERNSLRVSSDVHTRDIWKKREKKRKREKDRHLRKKSFFNTKSNLPKKTQKSKPKKNNKFYTEEANRHGLLAPLPRLVLRPFCVQSAAPASLPRSTMEGVCFCTMCAARCRHFLRNKHEG